MGFKCGIVGLPNVGKSTLFNALTKTASAQAANYPFCTIEPNTGEVGVPDPRLGKLAAAGGSANIIPTRLTFVDIAGLVRGASKGEGLGNQFLANIREVDAIAHVLRCFDDGDITHVEGKIDPVADADTVETELMLADMDSLERRVTATRKKAQVGDKEALADAADDGRGAGRAEGRQDGPHQSARLSEDERKLLRGLNLLTAKPVLYVCNVGEDAAAATATPTSGSHCRQGDGRRRRRVVISASIEAEIAQLSDEEQADYLESDRAGASPASTGMIRAGYELARPGHLLHRRAEGGACLDRAPRRPRAAGGRRHPHRFRTRLHPRPDHQV